MASEGWQTCGLHKGRGRSKRARGYSRGQHPHSHARNKRPNPVKSEVNALFDKFFIFEKSTGSRGEEWALPACDSLFPDAESEDIKNDWNQALFDLRCKLQAVQNHLSDKDIERWHAHTTSTHRGGQVMNELRRRFHIELGTQAWCKFYEILTCRNLIPDEALTSKPLHSVHICEAPGAFVCSLNHHLKTHREWDSNSWKWLATSLNPHCESNRPEHTIVDDRLLLQTPECWYFGEDNTGDVMSLANLRGLEKLVQSQMNGSVNLVTADGSINCQDDPGQQEGRVFPLLLCQALTAICTLDPAGSFLVKMFTMFNANTACLVYLLNCSFNQVTVVKPACSKAGNSEVYVVCKGFLGRDHLEPQLGLLLENFGQDVSNKLLFHPSFLPPSFVAQLEQCSDLFTSYQMSAIEENLRLYTGMDENQRKHLDLVREQCVETYIRRCQLRAQKKQEKLIRSCMSNISSMFGKNVHNRLHGSLEERAEEERSWEQQLLAIQRILLETGAKPRPGHLGLGAGPRVGTGTKSDSGAGRLRAGPEPGSRPKSSPSPGSRVEFPRLDHTEQYCSDPHQHGVKGASDASAAGPGGDAPCIIHTDTDTDTAGGGMQGNPEGSVKTSAGGSLSDSPYKAAASVTKENLTESSNTLSGSPGQHASMQASHQQDPGASVLQNTDRGDERTDISEASCEFTSNDLDPELCGDNGITQPMPLITWDTHGSHPPESWKVVRGQPLRAVSMSPFCSTLIFSQWRKLQTNSRKTREKVHACRDRDDLSPQIVRIIRELLNIRPHGLGTKYTSSCQVWLCFGFADKERSLLADLASSCNAELKMNIAASGEGSTSEQVSELLHRDSAQHQTFAGLFMKLVSTPPSPSSEPLSAELAAKQEFILACLLAFKVLEGRGSFHVMVPSLFTRFSVGLLYVLCLSFDLVTLARAQGANMTLPSVLISCRGYHRNQSLHQHLLRVWSQMEELQHGGSHDVLQFIPMANLYNPDFDKTLSCFNEVLLRESSLHAVRAELAAIHS